MTPRFLCALLTLLVAVTTLHAQDVHTPPKDSQERRAIMDAIRVPCERDLKQEVIFKVETLRVTEDWAYAAVHPLRPDGEDIDYRRTRFREQSEAGMFEPTGEALLRQNRDGSWRIIKWRFGGTDTVLQDWVRSEDAPKSLDRPEP